MQNATGGALVRSDDRDDNDRSIAFNLVTLIGHVQANMTLIESTIAWESSPGNQEVAANVIVLDDVTPRYAKAHAALSTCIANLGVALHLLLDTRASKPGTNASAEGGRPPIRSTGCA